MNETFCHLQPVSLPALTLHARGWKTRFYRAEWSFQDAGHRGLVALGIAAVGGGTVAAFTGGDAERYTRIAGEGPPVEAAEVPATMNGGAPVDQVPTCPAALLQK